MWEEIESIDWAKYRLPGNYSPDIFPLLQGLADKDYTIRWNSASVLSDVLQLAFERTINDFPFVIVPILIRLLSFSGIPQKSLVVGLLIDLVQYSDVTDIDSLDESPRRLKSIICKGITEYREILQSTDEPGLKEDIAYLIEQCSR
ncbi:MAG: hypothetical protein IPK52_07775 [Chloroflexi bacterium]|nr:hypothetical protein [Chloroflexota bacterium]